MLNQTQYRDRIPPLTLESLVAYANRGRPTGDFLRCVLTNDLMGAVNRADDGNRAELRSICLFVYTEMPSDCWGSEQRIREWIELGGLEGMVRRVEEASA